MSTIGLEQTILYTMHLFFLIPFIVYSDLTLLTCIHPDKSKPAQVDPSIVGQLLKPVSEVFHDSSQLDPD